MKVRGEAICVVGVAESDLGASPAGTTPMDLIGQAVGRALADSGLGLPEIDGIFACNTQNRLAPLAVAEYLGLRPRYFDGTNIGGASFMTFVARAQAALTAGLCDVALIAYASTQRTAGRAQTAPREFNPYETHLYGTTREQLAEVAVAARQWALLNPVAWEKKPLTVADVLGARMIADPFTVRDCCLVTDGGGAMLLTRADRARSLRKPPVYILGTGEALSHLSISSMPELTQTAARQSGEIAFARAGLSPSDIDVLNLYDAFTITPILFLEDLGFCPKGEGGAFVADGRIAPNGEIPLNTNGGGLSYCHPGQYGLLAMIEVVRQVRGDAGVRQVPNCNIGLAHGNGGVLSSECTVIFGSAP
jgi:acetyl-CoA acetyltransferase